MSKKESRPVRRTVLTAIFAIICIVLAISLTAELAPKTETPQKRSDNARIPREVTYFPAEKLATLKNSAIRESSGIAVSRRYARMFWTHNDSGNRAALYAFDINGSDLGTVDLQNASCRDWEDIASFTLDGSAYLLVADTGDNLRRRNVYRLLLLKEPDIAFNPDDTETAKRYRVDVLHTVRFRFENGPADCESIGVDMASRKILLIPKRKQRGVYELDLDQAMRSEDVLTAKRIADLHIPWPTGMDISPDSRRAIVLTYEDAYEYVRSENEDWSHAFRQKPRIIDLPKLRQGEAVCYGSDGFTLFLTSEKRPTPLWMIPARQNDSQHPAR